MVSFSNTKIAFSGKSNSDLNRSYLLFKLLSKPTWVKLGSNLTLWAIKFHLPIKWMVKKTIFKQFCGGENIDDCTETINKLGDFGIGAILDFSVEGKESETDFDNTMQETINTITKATQSNHIPFCVFKVTGVASFDLLEKITANKSLTDAETAAKLRVIERVDKICNAAAKAGIPIFIDAEESWIQQAIDDLADMMMQKFNQQKVIVYNTFQLYRKDRLAFLQSSLDKGKKQNYKIGAKLVRGAYMEKERLRAQQMGYESPIQKTKQDTDTDYDLALKFCLKNIEGMAICAGTHNEDSSLHLSQLMAEHKIANDDKRIYFSQLFGMSDNLSYNLANEGYKVAKYLPYGPVEETLPYLIRRAQENTSVEGQTGRELGLIMKEKERRKIEGK
jgi:proline dehydrogenase